MQRWSRLHVIYVVWPGHAEVSVIKTLPLFRLSGVMSVEIRVGKTFPLGVVQFPGNKFTFNIQVKLMFTWCLIRWRFILVKVQTETHHDSFQIVVGFFWQWNDRCNKMPEVPTDIIYLKTCNLILYEQNLLGMKSSNDSASDHWWH